MLEQELEQVDAFIAMSEFSRQKHKEFGFPRDMEVLPPILSNPESGDAGLAGARPHQRPYFLFVGRLEKIKGLDDVIPLFRDYDVADLLIAGEGDYAGALRALSRDIERVIFLGRMELEELRRYYKHAVALIGPSVCFETFGVTLIEAFKQSTPVIARRIGPFPEIVTRSGGGELFTTGEELVGAMRRLQADDVYRERLARSGYEAYLEHWSERTVIPAYLDIVRRVAEKKSDRRVLDKI